MTVSTFAINNLTVTQNHGNTTITAENMFRGGTHSTYVAQVLAIGKGAYTFVECQFDNEQTDAAYDGNPVHGTFPTLQAAAQAAFDFIVAMVSEIESAFAAGYPANNMPKYQNCGNTILMVTDTEYTTLAMIIACKNEYAGKYTAINCIGLSQIEISKAISQAETAPTTKFDSYLFAQKYAEMMVQNMLNNELCALEAFADAANAILHTAIAEQAELQNEAIEIADAFAELDLVPENADLELQYEALQAGAAFDNVAPTPISKQYDLSGDIYDLNEVIDTIATEQADDLQSIDSEIAALKARLLSLGSTRQDIVEEYAYWHSKAQQKLDDLEYSEAHDSNEAQADLRQSIWLSTGQDIM
jgi:hypothetical protein